MRKILVLGGSGLVGRAIFNELKDSNKYEVFTTYFNHPFGLERSFRLDIEDLTSLSKILNTVKPDSIVSCLRGDFDRQLVLHEKAAQFLKKNGGKLYFCSTTNVFDNDYSRPHFEDDMPDSQTDYGKYKIKCEKMLTEILHDNACILRLPQVWGKNCPRLTNLLESLGSSNKIKVYPRLIFNTTTNAMIARKFRYIIEHNMTGIFHIVSEDTINYKDFYHKLISALGYDKAVFEEDIEEDGFFALLSKRSGEFGDDLIWTNESVINEIVP